MPPSFLARRRNERLAIIPAKQAVGPTPTVISIEPDAGPMVGGTLVTITGADFVEGAKAYLGRVALLDVVYVDSGTLTGTTPARPPGVETLTIVNSAGHSASLPNAFTYERLVRPPILTEAGSPLFAEVNGVATEELILE